MPPRRRTFGGVPSFATGCHRRRRWREDWRTRALLDLRQIGSPVNNIIKQAAASRNPGPADLAVLGAPGRRWLHPSPAAGRGLPASHKAPAPPPRCPGQESDVPRGGRRAAIGGALALGPRGAPRAQPRARGRGARADLVAMGGPRHRRGPLWPRAWPPLGMPHAHKCGEHGGPGRLASAPRPASSNRPFVSDGRL
jgi:hypothetical protein